MRMNSEDRKRWRRMGVRGEGVGRKERWGGGEKGCSGGSDSGIKVNSNALFMALCVKISFTCAVLTHGS